jgi:hypothetical protein
MGKGSMQTFLEFYLHNEAVTMATRMKMKASMRKNKAKIAIGRKKAAKRLKSPDKLKTTARRKARDIIIAKLLKDKKKSDLSFAARQEIEKKVAKKQGAILRISKKLLPKIKMADRERVKKVRAAK